MGLKVVREVPWKRSRAVTKPMLPAAQWLAASPKLAARFSRRTSPEAGMGARSRPLVTTDLRSSTWEPSAFTSTATDPEPDWLTGAERVFRPGRALTALEPFFTATWNPDAVLRTERVTEPLPATAAARRASGRG